MRCQTILTSCRMSFRRWPVRLRDRTADRFTLMDLPAGNCRRNRQFARFASIRIRFQRSSTGWDTGASRFSPSRERTRCTDADLYRAMTTPSIPAIRLLQSIPPYYSLQYNGTISGAMSKRASYFFSVEQRNNQNDNIYSGQHGVREPLHMGTYNAPWGSAQADIFSPATHTNISPRIDLQFGQKNTLTVRYQFFDNHSTGLERLEFPAVAGHYQQLDRTHDSAQRR